MKLRRVYVAAAVAVGLAAAGCANNSETNSGSGGQPSASGTAGFNLDNVEEGRRACAQVDSKISSDGKLVVGTDPTYEPSEFKQNGKIVGFDVDLGDAIAKKLGLTAEVRRSRSSTRSCRRSAPAVRDRHVVVHRQPGAGEGRRLRHLLHRRHPVGVEGDNPSVDPDNACGKKVAVQTGTVQDTDDLAGPAEEVDAGNAIQVQRYDAQDEATNAVVLGKADAVLADSPVMACAVKKVGGGPQLVGDVYDSAPYGIAIPKNAGTTKDAVLRRGEGADRGRHVQGRSWTSGGSGRRDHRPGDQRRVQLTRLVGDDDVAATTAPRRATAPEDIKAVPVRHPGRWVAVAVLAVLVAMLVNSVVDQPRTTTGTRSASTSSTGGCPRPRWSRSS